MQFYRATKIHIQDPRPKIPGKKEIREKQKHPVHYFITIMLHIDIVNLDMCPTNLYTQNTQAQGCPSVSVPCPLLGVPIGTIPSDPKDAAHNTTGGKDNKALYELGLIVPH